MLCIIIIKKIIFKILNKKKIFFNFEIFPKYKKIKKNEVRREKDE